ncbi:ribosomal L28e protein family-domain-containing protein [Cristinia sonorae]|uniref:Ribosomal L28e protein family-domain-containing protein n=1 Tax=Cristinia sonorae TaxID=1940300 RepID=A0A8K0XN24_9AGAR|nr:ribosomal L28e protein family-domain-containing protein [Cristinia sonorae]
MSNDLQWLLIRKNNAHIVKRVPEGPIFSKEAGNLTNLHSFKYSGLVNTKTIDIKDSGNGIQITTTKKGASPSAVRTAKAVSSIRNRSGGRRSYGVVAQLAKRGYRPDLRKVCVFPVLFSIFSPPPSPPELIHWIRPHSGQLHLLEPAGHS